MRFRTVNTKILILFLKNPRGLRNVGRCRSRCNKHIYYY